MVTTDYFDRTDPYRPIEFYQGDFEEIYTEDKKSTAEMRKIMGNLPSYNPFIWVVGGRGYGKTQNLHYLTRMAFKNFGSWRIFPVFTYLELDIDQREFRKWFWKSIIDGMFRMQAAFEPLVEGLQARGEDTESFYDRTYGKSIADLMTELGKAKTMYDELDLERQTADYYKNKTFELFGYVRDNFEIIERIVILYDELDKYSVTEYIAPFFTSNQSAFTELRKYDVRFIMSASDTIIEYLETREELNFYRGEILDVPKIINWQVAKEFIEMRFGEEEDFQNHRILDPSYRYMADVSNGVARDLIRNTKIVLRNAMNDQMTNIPREYVEKVIKTKADHDRLKDAIEQELIANPDTTSLLLRIFGKGQDFNRILEMIYDVPKMDYSHPGNINESFFRKYGEINVVKAREKLNALERLGILDNGNLDHRVAKSLDRLRDREAQVSMVIDHIDEIITDNVERYTEVSGEKRRAMEAETRVKTRYVKAEEVRPPRVTIKIEDGIMTVLDQSQWMPMVDLEAELKNVLDDKEARKYKGDQLRQKLGGMVGSGKILQVDGGEMQYYSKALSGIEQEFCTTVPNTGIIDMMASSYSQAVLDDDVDDDTALDMIRTSTNSAIATMAVQFDLEGDPKLAMPSDIHDYLTDVDALDEETQALFESHSLTNKFKPTPNTLYDLSKQIVANSYTILGKLEKSVRTRGILENRIQYMKSFPEVFNNLEDFYEDYYKMRNTLWLQGFINPTLPIHTLFESEGILRKGNVYRCDCDEIFVADTPNVRHHRCDSSGFITQTETNILYVPTQTNQRQLNGTFFDSLFKDYTHDEYFIYPNVRLEDQYYDCLFLCENRIIGVVHRDFVDPKNLNLSKEAKHVDEVLLTYYASKRYKAEKDNRISYWHVAISKEWTKKTCREEVLSEVEDIFDEGFNKDPKISKLS